MISLRNRHFFLIDLVLLPATAVLAFVLRLDATGLEVYAGSILLFVALSVPVKLITFYAMGLYRRLWQYASVGELLEIALSTGISEAVTVLLLFLVMLFLDAGQGFPRSIPFIDGLLTLLAVGGPRLAARLATRSEGFSRDGTLIAGAAIVTSLLDTDRRLAVTDGWNSTTSFTPSARICSVRVGAATGTMTTAANVTAPAPATVAASIAGLRRATRRVLIGCSITR